MNARQNYYGASPLEDTRSIYPQTHFRQGQWRQIHDSREQQQAHRSCNCRLANARDESDRLERGNERRARSRDDEDSTRDAQTKTVCLSFVVAFSSCACLGLFFFATVAMIAKLHLVPVSHPMAALHANLAPIATLERETKKASRDLDETTAEGARAIGRHPVLRRLALLAGQAASDREHEVSMESIEQIFPHWVSPDNVSDDGSKFDADAVLRDVALALSLLTRQQLDREGV